MTVPKEEGDALRHILTILAPLHGKHERRTMALNIEQHIAGKSTGMLCFRFTQIASLFYPSNQEKANALAIQMQAAADTGELATILPKSERGAMFSDLAVWSDCPPLDADSPLRYWLPHLKVAAPISGPQDTTLGRGYWVLAVRHPSEYGLTSRQAQAMQESLTLTDPEHWKRVLADPKSHGYTAAQAKHLADWAMNIPLERNQLIPEQKVKGLADFHIGYYGDAHVQTWLAISAVSAQDAALLFFGENPIKYRDKPLNYGDPMNGEDPFNLMKLHFDDVARDGVSRNIRKWMVVARERNLQATELDGWEACFTMRGSPDVETVEQRRERFLTMFEEEEKRGKRGALQRVADLVGGDRSNVGKDIKKALAARGEQKRAGGGWTSQLVQDGKRTG